ncbi:deaminase [Nocardioides rubriscoriae]|uniref:deaminase n=1 Tax=Nocardioides rubriscoriae TaxID=642762 RepID=UPI0011DF6654|nr:deaminase [Nocardioides rubriscoriae]
MSGDDCTDDTAGPKTDPEEGVSRSDEAATEQVDDVAGNLKDPPTDGADEADEADEADVAGFTWRRDTPEMTGSLEVVVALVAPIGSPTTKVYEILARAFRANDYTPELIQISEILDLALKTPKRDRNSDRWTRLMNKGDKLRKRYNDQAAAALMAAIAINKSRRAQAGAASNRHLHVSIIRSLKREEEVRVLRQIYGERLIVIGISTPELQRRKMVEKTLRRDFNPSKAKALAARLIERDEDDEVTASGQRVRDAFEQCDAYLSGRPTEIQTDAVRVVELLLGQPWSTPLRDEQGMYHAHAAMFRSSAAGRQVGAAIVDDLGEVVAVGCNDVPRPHGGQFWPGDDKDRRDFRLATDANDAGKFDAVRELLTGLARSGWLTRSYEKLDDEERAELALVKAGPLGGTRVRNLIEFGRILHAEMAALMTSAREGRPVRGCTLYTTTYPCHECMRLIIGSGIRRVVYIDPYPKSLAAELFDEMIGETVSPEIVQVVPFTGVAPRLFPRVFELSNRAKDLRGTYMDWTDKSLRTINPEFSSSIVAQEEAAIEYMGRRRAADDTSETPADRKN